VPRPEADAAVRRAIDYLAKQDSAYITVSKQASLTSQHCDTTLIKQQTSSHSPAIPQLRNSSQSCRPHLLGQYVYTVELNNEAIVARSRSLATTATRVIVTGILRPLPFKSIVATCVSLASQHGWSQVVQASSSEAANQLHVAACAVHAATPQCLLGRSAHAANARRRSDQQRGAVLQPQSNLLIIATHTRVVAVA
jgi:hypothetical protein